jgi:PAS domain S-box-containing protein
MPPFCRLFQPAAGAELSGFATLVESGSDAILVIEISTTRVAYTNSAAAALLRLPREQINGATLGALCAPEENRPLIDCVQELVRRRGDVVLPEITSETGGAVKWLEPSAQVFVAEAWTFVRCTLRDVTERRKEAQRAETRRRFEALQRLAGGLSHDFNNMLTCIRGYSSIILETPGLPEDVREMIGLIDGAGVRATALSRRFLEFSRPDNYEPRPASVAGFLRNTLPALQQIAAPDARLVLDAIDERLFAMIDEAMLTKALAALVQNARDALPAPGDIQLGARAAIRRDLGQSTSIVGATIPVVEIAITDGGRGMSPVTLEQVFEPGFTMKKSAGAPGMGLPTAYRIAREHGGEVEIFSKQGTGTTVLFVLPRLVKVPENSGTDDAQSLGDD